MGLSQRRKLSLHIFNQGWKEATGFHKNWIWAAYQAFCSLQKGVSCDNDPSLFWKAALAQEAALLDDCITPMLDEAPALLCLVPLAEPHPCYAWTPGELRQSQRRHAQGSTCHHCHQSLKSLCSARGRG